MSGFRFSDTERELMDITRDIGNISEANYPYFHALASVIDAQGKPLGELTLAELIRLQEKIGRDYKNNRLNINDQQ